MSRRKPWKPILHLINVILISYYISLKTPKFVSIKRVNRFREDMRHILLWTKIPGLEVDGQETFIRHKCQHINCYLTSNRTFFPNLGYYDAILFNLQDVSTSFDVPDVRSVTQKYIFVANDSADNFPICDPYYDTFFNWTWTYKQDSTLPYTHFKYLNKNDEELKTRFKWITKMAPINPIVQSQLTSKYKAAAIFLDKCESRSKREVYIKNLQSHLEKFNLTVDIFGKCGPKTCRRRTMGNCFWRLKHQYYFYLAMEDSIAADYITRDVLYAYQNYAVPVVFGGASYADYLPPNSYLNARELNEELMATAINEAIRNQSIYHDFFRWRNHYSIEAGQGMEPCGLCAALNNPYWLKFHTKHRKFRKWWNPDYERRCAKSWTMLSLGRWTQA